MQNDDGWLISGFGEIYPAHVSAFIELMIILRRDFDGDLDVMVILAIIGDRRFSKRAEGVSVTYDQLGNTPVADDATPAINAHSIAQFAGMPRETVRRKVAQLIERGWVERDERGDLRPTEKAAADLQASTDATLDYLRRIIAACDRVRSGGPG